MKTLVLMRHAKSDWANEGLSDHDRPLNKRGEQDAPTMGKWFSKQKTEPELWLSSTAKRAEQTIKKVAKECGKTESEIVFDSNLYAFSFAPYVDVLQHISNEIDSVFLVAHNPSIEELVFYLSKERHEVPTASIIKLELNCAKWSEIESGCGKMEFFVTPKSL